MTITKKVYSASDAQPSVAYAHQSVDDAKVYPVYANTNGSLFIELSGDTVVSNTHTSSKELRVFQENHVCIENTTSTPLDANDTFTGEWQDCLNYQEVNVSVFSDKDSATNGLIIEWSDDAVNVGDDDRFSVYANAGTNYTPNPAFRYVRIKYTNGSVTQTKFHLMTILRRGVTGGSFHRIDSTLKDDSDGRLTLSIPKLKTAANTYVSQTATTAGNAKMSLEELETGISDDTKTKLKVSPYLVDEFGTVSRMLSDNIYSGSPVTINVEHHEIHCGDSYVLSRVATLSGSSTDNLLIVVPNETGSTQKLYHLTIGSDFSTDCTFELYEGVTASNTGTTLSWYNRQRNSSNSTNLITTHSPTTSGTGTLIYSDRAGTRSTSSSISRSEEFVLKNNTSYIARLINNVATAGFASWRLNHYIHPGI